MRWWEKIVAAHTSVTDQVSHLERMQTKRYFVWQEDGENNLHADDAIVEKAVTGFTDLFTTVEFDPWADHIENAFDHYGLAWSLRGVQYEEDTGIIHYTWDWEVTDGDGQN